MRVRVLFFGPLRDIVNQSEQEIETAAETSLETVFHRFAELHPRLVDLRPSIVFARNRQFAPPTTLVEDGDEIAFLPPVSGGADRYTHEVADPAGHFFAITRDPIATADLARRFQQPEDGAVVTFEGVVRNNTKGRETRYLEYDCYEPMAIEVMARLGREIAASLPISRIGMVHRLGRMEIGEASVVVIATAPHRNPAFEAALEGINRLKKTVPIWKKEFFADGEVWVEGEWDDSLRARS